MSAIDEIMAAVVSQYRVIGDLIAAALADAEKRGAEQMREACAKACGETYPLAIAYDGAVVEIEARRYPAGMTAGNIRALPLPAGPRQAVRLTDEEARREIASTEWDAIMDHCYEFGTADEGQTYYRAKFARAIEAAVLAANGLEAK